MLNFIRKCPYCHIKPIFYRHISEENELISCFLFCDNEIDHELLRTKIYKNENMAIKEWNKLVKNIKRGKLWKNI